MMSVIPLGLVFRFGWFCKEQGWFEKCDCYSHFDRGLETSTCTSCRFHL